MCLDFGCLLGKTYNIADNIHCQLNWTLNKNNNYWEHGNKERRNTIEDESEHLAAVRLAVGLPLNDAYYSQMLAAENKAVGLLVTVVVIVLLL